MNKLLFVCRRKWLFPCSVTEVKRRNSLYNQEALFFSESCCEMKTLQKNHIYKIKCWDTPQISTEPHYASGTILALQAKIVLVTQSCLTLYNPMNCSPPGSSVHGIFQARILERVAISFSRGSSGPRNRTQVSCIAGGFLHYRQILLLTELQGKPLWPYMGEFISRLSILSYRSKCLSLLHSGNFWNQEVCNFQLRYSFSTLFWL